MRSLFGVTGAAVLLLWIPQRQRPGVGTVLNVIVVGLAADVGLWLIEQPDDLLLRVLLLVGGVVGNGFAGALYIGARLGSGPRDGLWLALVRLTGRSIRFWRTTSAHNSCQAIQPRERSFLSMRRAIMPHKCSTRFCRPAAS